MLLHSKVRDSISKKKKGGRGKGEQIMNFCQDCSFTLIEMKSGLGEVAQTCNPSAWEVEV